MTIMNNKYQMIMERLYLPSHFISAELAATVGTTIWEVF